MIHRPSLLPLGLAVAALALAPLRAGAVEMVEMVEMDDGVHLHTEVTLPDDAGPFPVILVRTPYKQQGMEQISLVTAIGYAVVFQHTRGTGKSEGEVDVFFTDASDGHRTAEWLLEQPWSNGTFSMFGASALAIPEYLMAPGAPSAMLCQVLAIATPDVYAHGVFHGGVFKKKTVESWTGWIKAGSKLDMLADHRLCDAFWDPVRVTGQGADVRAAAVHLGGWFDVFTQGTLDGYAMYSQTTEPWAVANQYLIMGPWEHHLLGQATAGELTFPSAAELDIYELAFSWADFCNGGWDTGWAPVQYYVMGPVGETGAPGNVWREAESWPPPSVETPLYLTAADALAWAAPEAEVSVVFPFDPADPSPTVGGRNLSLAAGPRDQAKVEARSDAVVLSTAVLDEPFEVTGRLFASLMVATNASDADVVVRLTDVYPDGRSMLVTEGVQRLSMRDGCEAPVEVVPGEPARVEVDLWSTSYVFAAGHRLRVVLTGSNYPRYELSPGVVAGTGAVPPVEITVTSTPGEPSFLRLPLPAPDEPPPDDGPEAVEPGPEDVEIGPEAAESLAEAVESILELEPTGEVVEAVEVIEPIVEPEPAVEVVEPVAEPAAEAVDTALGEVASEITPDAGAFPDAGPAIEAEADAGALADGALDASIGSPGRKKSGCGAAPGGDLLLLGLVLAAAALDGIRRRRCPLSARRAAR